MGQLLGATIDENDLTGARRKTFGAVATEPAVGAALWRERMTACALVVTEQSFGLSEVPPKQATHHLVPSSLVAQHIIGTCQLP